MAPVADPASECSQVIDSLGGPGNGDVVPQVNFSTVEL
ncbi:hypothetical protein PACID_05210 [Acidipropionibacterium acidipropionici ATCC 4875]|uniref:Uncharacterized protein n=1 Tax=Acidipropionibacterium acidipropionici (strain ATCC 4875 / DSM 20272 / JCM 6432 / NBRC 12425 / NCIMB 8070 / 4) TaxID=1171373 RepID=K7S1F7_ACIA4|nr:hypothetical protein PACID_05210 [Acidipropionibacterium acidipropionici ATCC 4875]